MRRWLRKWWWLCVVIGAAVLMIGWQESHCLVNAERCRAYYTAQESRRLGFNVSSDAPEQEAINQACEPNGYFCRLFSAANLPAWLLVFVGTGGIAAAVRTLKFIEKQTGIMERQTAATEQSARSAEKNIAAFIDGERAWLMGDQVGIQPPPEPTKERAVYWIYVPVKNSGKTVGRIFESGISVRLTQSLPAVPEYDYHGQYDIAVVPGGAHRLWVGVHPPDMEIAKTGKADKTLYVYGFVRYSDIGGNFRETRFCYFYHVPNNYAPDPEGFYPSGNTPTYIKST